MILARERWESGKSWRSLISAQTVATLKQELASRKCDIDSFAFIRCGFLSFGDFLAAWQLLCFCKASFASCLPFPALISPGGQVLLLQSHLNHIRLSALITDKALRHYVGKAPSCNQSVDNMGSRTGRISRKVKVEDLYSFTLEVSSEDAAVLNDLKRRVKDQDRLWWSIEASKGAGWYLQPDILSSSEGSFVSTLSLATYANAMKLKKLIRTGIPPALRPKVWLAVSGAAKKRSTVPQSYYNDLIEAVEGKVTPATRQIDHDLSRTFPSHPWLDCSEGHQCLRRVLVAYSFRDSRVGYCQGMNYIAAFLLLVMRKEEDAFWMLAVLLENVLFSDTYSDNLYGCHIKQRVFKDLMKQKSPRLAAHFDLIGFDVSLVTTEWFLCLFSKNLPSETAMRVWDVLFNEGTNVLFVVALGVFKMKEEELLSVKHVGEAIKILQDATHVIYDPDVFLKVAFEKLGFMTTYAIARHRKKQQPVVMAELQQKVLHRCRSTVPI